MAICECRKILIAFAKFFTRNKIADFQGLRAARQRYHHEGMEVSAWQYNIPQRLLTEVWIQVSTGLLRWGPPNPNLDWDILFPEIEGQNTELPFLAPTPVQWNGPSLIHFNSPNAVEEYFEDAVEKNSDNFFSMATTLGSMISGDPFVTCQLGAMIALESEEVLGHIPFLSRRDVVLQPWQGFDNSGRKVGQLHGVASEWSR